VGERETDLSTLSSPWAALQVSPNTANSTNPLPDTGNIPAAAFTNGCADVGIPFDYAANTFPESLPSTALQLRPQNIITQLADRNPGFSGVPTSIQRRLCSQAVKSGGYEVWHAGHVRTMCQDTGSSIG
jgi:hypothetical protein